MIIGITGTLASGKGTVVDSLTEKGFVHYSVSAMLKDVLKERGLPLTRPHLSQLASEFASAQEGGVFRALQERAVADGAVDYVLEAIHRESEANYLRSIGAHIWGVDADLETRYVRTLQRADGEKDDVTFEEFVAHTRREDEGETGSGPHIRAVIKGADVVFMNNSTLEELRAQIVAALAVVHSAA